MKFTRVIALAFVAASASVAGAQAQNLRSVGEPAEFPPSSYKGTQYTDSKGCVFVRAGISGDVSWIPRVSRSRDQICNQEPSLSNAVTSAAPKRKPAPEPVQISLDTPVAVAPSAPVVEKVTKAAPKPVRAKRQASIRTPAVVAKPAVVARAPVAVAPTVPVEQTEANNATRIVPRHVSANRQNTQNLPVPAGYERVWNDGRLNPKRAEQSILGQAQVRLIWTQTVPRRLVDVTSGRDVTASIPLVYPYVDEESQTRDLGSVQLVRRDGQLLKRVVRNPNAVRVREPVVSSRSAPVVAPKAQKAKVKAASSGFVNIGTFTAQRQAQDAAKRIQRMGLPVRIGKFDRAGKTYRMVLAGPFGSEAQVYLKKLRSAGYENAALR